MSEERIPATLVTGASGEIGAALLRRLADEPEAGPVLSVDLRPLPDGLGSAAPREHFRGDILDEVLWERLERRFRPHRVFHLAAVLSTRAEEVPRLAHRVNAEGAARLLSRSLGWAEPGRPTVFFFPSSIAVYGFPSRAAKFTAGPVAEDERLDPRTIYGAQKLYVERLGAAMERTEPGLDFRAARFPGLISADTLPQGGTSDWAPELIHAAARGEPYSCFVDEDARLPFCAMPDAIEGIRRLALAAKPRLTRAAYNFGGASLSASEIISRVRRDFPALEVRFALDRERAGIVAGWPAAVDDRAARRDFGFAPERDAETLFSEYLIPGIRRRYADGRAPSPVASPAESPGAARPAVPARANSGAASA